MQIYEHLGDVHYTAIGNQNRLSVRQRKGTRLVGKVRREALGRFGNAFRPKEKTCHSPWQVPEAGHEVEVSHGAKQEVGGKDSVSPGRGAFSPKLC